MEGIIYIMHGSRVKFSKRQEQAFINHLLSLESLRPQGIAYLEHHPQTLEKVTTELVAKGCTTIRFVPVLLAPATHSQLDIPQKVAGLQQAGEAFTPLFIETFGHLAETKEVVKERVGEIWLTEKWTPNQTVVLLYHGSNKYAEPERRMKCLAQQLSTEWAQPVKLATLHGREDYLTTLKRIEAEAESLIVMPFFIGEGKIVKQIRENLADLVLSSPLFVTKTLDYDIRLAQGIHRQALASTPR